jgi:hypothetical protein
MQSFNQFISNAEFRNSISNMLRENNSVLLETIINDTRTKIQKMIYKHIFNLIIRVFIYILRVFHNYI